MPGTLRIVFGLAACACLLCCGCNRGAKDPSKLGAQHDKAFQSAQPEVKACWDNATAAMATNGYAAAMMALQQLLEHTNATPEQIQGAHETVLAVNAKMYEAANKGDPNALQSIQELRKASGR